MVTEAQVRARVAAAIAAELAAAGWRESTGVYDTFGTSEGDARFHKAYAVGVPSDVLVGDTQRQRASEGVLVVTDVRVRWAWAIAALDQVATHDEALDGGAAVRTAVMTISQGTDLRIAYAGATRAVDADGWMLGELRFRAVHQLALQ